MADVVLKRHCKLLSFFTIIKVRNTLQTNHHRAQNMQQGLVDHSCHDEFCTKPSQTQTYVTTRNAFCGTWYLPHSHVHNERTVPIIMARCNCAWAKWRYFHFQWKIWHHHRVPRPRFPLGRENFGDLHTFKADIGLLNICMGFQDLLA